MSGPGPTPPGAWDRLLRAVLPRDDAGLSVLGDLRQEYARRHERDAGAARRWFRGQAVGVAGRFLALRLGRGLRALLAVRPLRRIDMDALLQDLRFAARSLARNPGFTVVALLVLSLGIGATTAIFSVVDGVLVRSLPYDDADRLVRVEHVDRERSVTSGKFSPQDFDDLVAAQSSFASLARYWSTPGQTIVNLLGDGPPQRLEAAYVGPEFFATLGVEALVGRTFAADETIPGNDDVVVLGHALWQARFGGDPGVVGRTVSVDGSPRVVVGVMPASFEFPDDRVQLWLPISLIGESSIPSRRDVRWLTGIGRLAEGVDVDAARSETDRILATLAREFPESNASWERGRVTPLRQALVGDVRGPLLLLLASTGMILLIVCANVGTLLLARADGRSGEVAVRISLGASPGRLVRQVLSEAVVLSLVGAAGGMLLARWGVEALVASSAGTIPLTGAIEADARVAAFAVAVSVATGIVFGLVPAWRVARSAPSAQLRGGVPRRWGRGGGGATFVVVQTALAVMLVVGSGLMIRSLGNMLGVDTGVETEHALAVEMSAKPDLERSDWTDRLVAYRREIVRAVSRVPGVVAAGGSKALPFDGGGEPFAFGVRREDGSVVNVTPESGAHLVTPGYFEALGVDVLQGRTFRESDDQPVLVVNRALAESLWPGESAVGKRLWAGSETPLEVIGVVENVRHEGLLAPVQTAIYAPDYLAPRVSLALVVRGEGDVTELADPVRSAVWSVNADQAMAEIRTLDEVLRSETARSRFVTALLTAFAGLALVLATVGLYGVMAHTVGRRRDEIGLRQALGAERGDVARMVLADGLRTTGLGLVLGVVGAFALGRVFAGLLYGVTPTDPVTFAVVGLTFLVVSLLASAVPTVRAVRVDPARTLERSLAK